MWLLSELARALHPLTQPPPYKIRLYDIDFIRWRKADPPLNENIYDAKNKQTPPRKGCKS
jgi:hypothetical protein